MHNQVNILIIEDEAIVAMELQESLQQEGFNVLAIADNGKEAIDLYQKNVVDLVLLDINIKGNLDGIDTATELKKYKNTPLIYITAYADTVTFERAKSTMPSAFLIKPYRITDLLKAIELALHNFSNQKVASMTDMGEKAVVKREFNEQENILHFNDAIFIKQNYKYNKIGYEDILYLKADGNYTYLQTLTKKFIIKHSLQNVLEIFNTDRFVRVHRSFAINISHLTSFSETSMQIMDEEIPLGRNYKDVFLGLFKQL